MHRLGLIFFSAIILFASPAAAKDIHQDRWTVSQLSGDARVVHAGLQSASLKLNNILVPGDVVITGASGRAMLSHNDADYIVVAPRSELRLPTGSQPGGFTRVIQKVGTMLFRIQHTGVPHFAVDTPMLAAVVKGTTFTIIVDQNRSAVQVTQGVVEVSANEGGMKELVAGGRTVFIENRNPKAIRDADASTESSPNAAGAVKVSGSRPASLTTITGLMSGLVRPEATPQPSQSSAPSVSTVSAAPPPVAAATDPVGAASEPVSGVGVSITEPVTDVAGGTTVPVTDAVGTVTAPITEVIGTATTPVTDVSGSITPPAGNVVTTVTAPVTDVIGSVTPPVGDVVTTVTAPVTDVGGSVTAPVTDVVITAPVTEVIGAVTAPVTEVATTVTAPVTEVIGTVVAPVTDTITTVTTPVPEVVTTVTTPITTVVEPVTQPATGLIGGLPDTSPPASPAPAPAPPPPPPPPLPF